MNIQDSRYVQTFKIKMIYSKDKNKGNQRRHKQKRTKKIIGSLKGRFTFIFKISW
jgi:hypothetical protein